MPIMGLLNVTIERLVYRPLRHAPRLAPLITAIGVSFILQNIVLIIVGDRRPARRRRSSRRTWQIPFGARIDLGPVDLHLRRWRWA